MVADLYNLESLVHTLAPTMLNLPPGGGRWIPTKFPGGLPVVEVIGDHATGKTTALDALYTGYHRHVPTAQVDLGEAQYTAVDPVDRERLDTVNASPVTNLLFTISHELQRQPDKGYALSFPRLSPALLVITAWNPDPPVPGTVRPAELAEAEREIRSILIKPGPPAQESDPVNQQRVLERWLRAVNGILAGLLPGVPGLKEVLDAATATLLERRANGPGLTWWRTQLPNLSGNAVQRLFDLVQKFRGGVRDRAWVEAQLLAALLADIDAAFNWWTRRTRHPPLLLLDNVDDELT